MMEDIKELIAGDMIQLAIFRRAHPFIRRLGQVNAFYG
jgi:hypothetical protein